MTLRVINVVSSESRALPLIPCRTCCCVAPLGDQSADPRRGAAHGGELCYAAGTAAAGRGIVRLSTGQVFGLPSFGASTMTALLSAAAAASRKFVVSMLRLIRNSLPISV